MLERRKLFGMALFSFLSSWFGPVRSATRKFDEIAAFRHLIMTVLKDRHLAEKIVPSPTNPAKFDMVAHGEVSTTDVTNIYNYLASSPDEDPVELIDQFIRSITEDHNAPIDDANIVAVIRTRDYVNSAKLDMLYEPLGANLITLYMVDRPDSMSALTKDNVHGRDVASVRAVALDNIRQWLPKVVSDGELDGGVLYYVEGNTMLSTSLILLDDFWKSVAARFPGDVLIALPRKDQLFVFDDNGNKASRADIRRLIEATFKDNFNLLSRQLYARRGGKIVAVTD